MLDGLAKEWEKQSRPDFIFVNVSTLWLCKCKGSSVKMQFPTIENDDVNG